jgi:DNA-binding response OmpR family regulator
MPNAVSKDIRSEFMTVLNVVRDVDHIQQLKCLLKHSNWKLLFAGTLEEVREQLNKNTIAVVLFDDLLPESFRRDVLRLVHAEGLAPRVVMLVPPELEHDGLDFFRQGVLGVFGPDYGPEEIRFMVGEAGRCWYERRSQLEHNHSFQIQ